MRGWCGQDNVLNVRDLEVKSATPQLYLPADDIKRSRSYTIQQRHSESQNGCKWGKGVVFFLLLLVVAVGIGIYFAAISSGKEEKLTGIPRNVTLSRPDPSIKGPVNTTDNVSESGPGNQFKMAPINEPDREPINDLDTMTEREPITDVGTMTINKSVSLESDAVLTRVSLSGRLTSTVHTDLEPIPTITGQDIIFRNVGNIEQSGTEDGLFSTDPLCRNQDNAAIFVFSCFNYRKFQRFPDNDTIKCNYLRQVGQCIELLVEERYRVTCNDLDQLYVLRSSAELIKRNVNFDVIVQCPDLWEYYYNALHDPADGTNQTAASFD